MKGKTEEEPKREDAEVEPVADVILHGEEGEGIREMILRKDCKRDWSAIMALDLNDGRGSKKRTRMGE